MNPAAPVTSIVRAAAMRPATVPNMDLYLFSTDAAMIGAAVEGGAAGVVVDWETRGKAARQDGFDTQVCADTVDDLDHARAATHAPILCRINPVGATTVDEVEAAVRGGADELLVPMVRAPDEVERVRELARDRVAVGLLVETRAAVERVDVLARLDPSRVFIGLNDLLVERGTGSLFTPVVDGLVDHLRAAFAAPFGFGGLTLPEGGTPIPAPLLAAEMVRLRCDFTFLRRSFLRDARACGYGEAVGRILALVADMRGATTTQLDAGHAALTARVAEMDACAA